MLRSKKIWAVCFLIQQLMMPFVSAQAPDFNPQFQQEINTGTGVQSQPTQTEDPFAIQGYTTPGTPIPAASTTEVPIYSRNEMVSPLEKEVTIRAKQTPLETILETISTQARISFVVSEKIRGRLITAYLRDVTVRDALGVLAKLENITYQRVGKTSAYLIIPKEKDIPNLSTKIYTLNYISLIDVNQATGNMGSLVSSSSNTGGFVAASTGGGSSSSSSSSTGNSSSSIAIINVIGSVLTKEYGRIQVEPRTNSLIITDQPDVFPQVEQIIAELDRKAPQVLIEAQIVEINTDRANEVGIDWGGQNGELAMFQGGQREINFLLRDAPFSSGAWSSFYPSDGEITYGLLDLSQLTVLLKALVSRSEARYLGRPKVVALNNQTSVITITKQTAASTSNIESNVGSGISGQSIERVNTGLSLAVTPQVNREGYITLLVQPSYTDVQASVVTQNGQTVYDPITRGVNTMVRVQNGKTVVLGGLISSSENVITRKVPLLGYIPIIGWFFTSTSKRKQNTDMVILITPTILLD